MALAENVNIPEAFSLTSIDNSELAKLNAVPLTSVTHPMDALGYKVAESMLRLIENPDANVTYEFPVAIEPRASVKQIAQAQ